MKPTARQIMALRKLANCTVEHAAKALADADGDQDKAVKLLLVRRQGRVDIPAWKIKKL